MKDTEENDVINACLQYLNLRGWCAWRVNNVAVYDTGLKRHRAFVGLKGVPDIECMAPAGVTIRVECKGRGGKLSADQKAFIDKAHALGHLAFVVRSVGELIDGLKAEGF